MMSRSAWSMPPGSDCAGACARRSRGNSWGRPSRPGDEGQPPGLRLVREDVAAEPLPIGLVVAGAYRPGGSWRASIVRGAHAALPLVDGTVLAREEAARMLQLAAGLAPTVVTLR